MLQEPSVFEAHSCGSERSHSAESLIGNNAVFTVMSWTCKVCQYTCLYIQVLSALMAGLMADTASQNMLCSLHVCALSISVLLSSLQAK